MLLSPTASQAEGLVFRIDHTRSNVGPPFGLTSGSGHRHLQKDFCF